MAASILTRVKNKNYPMTNTVTVMNTQIDQICQSICNSANFKFFFNLYGTALARPNLNFTTVCVRIKSCKQENS